MLQIFQFGVMKMYTVNLGIFDWANFEDKEEKGEISNKYKTNQNDWSLLDIFLESQEVEKSLMAKGKDVSTLFFWFQVPRMLLSQVTATNFYVS